MKSIVASYCFATRERIVVVISPLAIVVCLFATDLSAQQSSSVVEKTRSCLASLDQKRPSNVPPDKDFDISADQTVDGLSFACDILIRASEARAAIETFKLGVATKNAELLNRAILFPIDVHFYETSKVDDRGTIITVKDGTQWIEMVSGRLSTQQRAEIACASVRTASIQKGNTYGFSISTGVLFVPINNEIKVFRVYIYPLADARVVEDCAR